MAFFLMRCLNHPEVQEQREKVRPEHREWVSSGGKGLVSVLIGSALIDEAGRSCGNFGILEAKSRADVEAFAEGDPFRKAGIVATIELTQLPDTFQVGRISEPMSPRVPTQ